MKDVYFTVDEVAAKLDVHSRTVRRYIASGEMIANKIGGQWRIRKEDLTSYINGERNSNVDKSCHIKEDDLCVFMDTEYYKSDQNLQICTIIDYLAETREIAQPISEKIMRTINSCECHGNNTKFQYVYKEKEKLARFVVWGDTDSIAHIMNEIKEFEEIKQDDKL